jgi:hypothetical protein
VRVILCWKIEIKTPTGFRKARTFAIYKDESSFVQQVEDAGAGDLSRADVAGLQIWLTKHSDVARSIAPQCKEAMKADTAWQNSEEGRICIAEKDAGFSN